MKGHVNAVLRAGREEVRRYRGQVVAGEVTSARPADSSAEGDPRFTVTLADGAAVRARRLLIATGLRDVLPDIPGLAAHWGHGVVHCPYCHGWEVRDEPVGILAAGPASVHQALLFRQLTDDLIYFSRGSDLDLGTRKRFAARGIRVVDTAVARVESTENGGIAGVRLTDGHHGGAGRVGGRQRHRPVRPGRRLRRGRRPGRCAHQRRPGYRRHRRGPGSRNRSRTSNLPTGWLGL